MKKIAVIGAGIFGITTALKCAERGHEVHLFERNPDILMSASGINQFRLHRGYHYPRSKETTESSLNSEKSFRTEYSGAIIDDPIEHYYGIAKKDSLTSGREYLEFCKKFGLSAIVSKPAVLNGAALDLCVRAKEALIDPVKLKNICQDKLKADPKIKVQLNTSFKASDESKFDKIVNCTYSNLNFIHDEPNLKRDYQFELCEKPVVKLPASFKNKSVVIMDGPFGCVDPFGKTGNFVLGNVVHAIHATNIGKEPLVPKKFMALLNRGVLKDPPVTNFKKFIESAAEFMPDIKKAVHVGSMYTIRTVLPHLEKTDSRPTIVKEFNEKTIDVFSGKLSNAVLAAEEVIGMINHDGGES